MLEWVDLPSGRSSSATSGNPVNRPLTRLASLLPIWLTISQASTQRATLYWPHPWIRLACWQASSLLPSPGPTQDLSQWQLHWKVPPPLFTVPILACPAGPLTSRSRNKNDLSDYLSNIWSCQIFFQTLTLTPVSEVVHFFNPS